MRRDLHPAAHFDFEIGANLLKELFCGHPCLIRANEDREILGHVAIFNGLDADFLECFGKTRNFNPPVHAKMDAIGLVDVALPC